MLIELVLAHCINPACISLKKAVVFSKKKKWKKKCAWLSLAACFRATASASVFRYLKEEKKVVKVKQLNVDHCL